jgi:hypothetical protein
MVYRLKMEDNPSSMMIAHSDHVGFQNPVFNDILDLERIEPTLSENVSLNNMISNGSLDMAHSSMSIDELKLINNRATNTLASQEMNFVCFNHVFSVKTRTYVNFKKSVQMLKPLVVLLFMIIVLIGLFRLDILTGSQILNGDGEEDE